VTIVDDTASTTPKATTASKSEGASTALLSDVSPRLSWPGKFIAAFVLSAGLGTGAVTGGRRDEVAESSTALTEVDPVLLRTVRDLFEQGASEFFQDGVDSNFSRALLKLLAQHGRKAFQAIAEYVFSGDTKPDVVSEALRWLADFNDASTLPQRWAILERTLKDPSPRVRDGAILGFAALDDPRAKPLLLKARELERMAELRGLIDQVIAQLGRSR
jgi:hypothetical protein